MKRMYLLLAFLFISLTAWSQELATEKNYDFANILEQNKNENHKFTATTFYTQINKQNVLSFVSYVEFPIIEEKETWKFGEIRQEYTPIINLNSFYKSIPKFTNFSPYAQQYVNQLQGKMKILKGYDFCGRPIY